MSPAPITRRRFVELSSSAVLASAAKPIRTDTKAGTLLVTHPAFLDHVTGPIHPERPARMKAIDAALAAPEFGTLHRQPAPLRDDVEAAILRVHSQTHLDKIQVAAKDAAKLSHAFDPDTIMSVGSWEAAQRAVGAGLLAVDGVMDKGSGIANAFCQVRPPGHHAERDRIMGFCLLNNLAIAAAYARAKHGLERIAIIDFDVHHGNGTQQIFWSDRATLYGSTHQMPLFPGTGAVSETGAGNIVNAPLRPDDGSGPFREAMTARILPELDKHKPDLIFVSTGFDAHIGDPLAQLRLIEDDFTWITRRIVEAAHKHCSGRIVSILEGGYSLKDLATSTAAHVRALMMG